MYAFLTALQMDTVEDDNIGMAALVVSVTVVVMVVVVVVVTG